MDSFEVWRGIFPKSLQFLVALTFRHQGTIANGCGLMIIMISISDSPWCSPGSAVCCLFPDSCPPRCPSHSFTASPFSASLCRVLGVSHCRKLLVHPLPTTTPNSLFPTVFPFNTHHRQRILLITLLLNFTSILLTLLIIPSFPWRGFCSLLCLCHHHSA